MRPASGARRLHPLEHLVLLGLVAAIGAVWLPTAADWATAFLGIDYVDALGTQWFYWFVDHELGRGKPLGHTDLFFYPWGKDIFGHTGTNVLDAVFAIPPRRLLGPVLGYNLFLLGALLLSAVALWRLIGDHVADPFARRAALLVGLLLPFPLFEVLQGRPTQAILLFPILFVRHMLRTGARRGWVDPTIAGLALAISGYQYWYYAFFGGLVCLAWGAAVSFTTARGGWLRSLVRFAWIAVVAMITVAPVGVPLALQAGEADVPGLLDMGRWTLHSSPPTTVENMTVGLFLWQPLRHYGGFFVLAPDGTERFLIQTVLMSPPLLAAGALGLALAGPQRRLPLLLAIGVTAAVGCGPLLLVGDVGLPNIPYMAMIGAVGALQRLWWPARIVAFTGLLLPIGLGLLLAALRRRGRLLPALAVAGLAAPLLHDLRDNHMLPMPTWDATIPAGYRCLAEGPPGAIIELPFDWTQAHLYYQSAHGRPILGGMLEDNPVFSPKELADLRQKNALVAQLLTLGQTRSSRAGEGTGLRGLHAALSGEDEELDSYGYTVDPRGLIGPVQPMSTDPKGELVALGYRYVVLQLDALTPANTTASLADNALRARARRMTRELGVALGTPVYEDARIAIFPLSDEPRPCAGAGWTPDLQARGYRQHPAGDIRQQDVEATAVRRLGSGPVDSRGAWRDDGVLTLPLPAVPRDWRGGEWPTSERQATLDADKIKKKNPVSRP
jgi:hypothetical protein